MKALRAKRPEAKAIILTGYGAIATAVVAVKLGAYDYLAKPVNADEIVAVLTAERSQHVDGPDFRGKPETRRPVRHIQHVGGGVYPGGPHLLDRVGERQLIDVGDDDLRPFSSERLGVQPSHAPGRAGDQDRFPSQLHPDLQVFGQSCLSTDNNILQVLPFGVGHVGRSLLGRFRLSAASSHQPV